MKRSREEIGLVRNWLNLARENLLFARGGMEADYSPHHTVCFLCQSAAEKYRKAFLIWNGWKLKKIHDLEELLSFCADYEPASRRLQPQCALLNEYITEARYPADLPFESIGQEEAAEALEAAEKIARFVLESLDLSTHKKTKKSK